MLSHIYIPTGQVTCKERVSSESSAKKSEKELEEWVQGVKGGSSELLAFSSDVNECVSGRNPCHSSTHCLNSVGSLSAAVALAGSLSLDPPMAQTP